MSWVQIGAEVIPRNANQQIHLRVLERKAPVETGACTDEESECFGRLMALALADCLSTKDLRSLINNLKHELTCRELETELLLAQLS